MSGLFERLGHELDSREKAAGLSMADVLSLPDEMSRLFNWVMRQEEVSFDDIVSHLGQDEKTVQQTLSLLIEKGFIREMEVKGQPSRYRVRLAPKRGREIPLNIWQALDEKTQKGGGK